MEKRFIEESDSNVLSDLLLQKIIGVTGFLLKKKRKIPKNVIAPAENWLENHQRYFQKIGGRSWAPLKAKIGHKGTLLQTDKQKRNEI